jgi:hypothetical protein
VAGDQIQRRLMAILIADVAGYSRLIGIDDEGTLAQLNAHHAELIEPKIIDAPEHFFCTPDNCRNRCGAEVFGLVPRTVI